MRINPTLLLSSLTDENFEKVKILFLENQETLSHAKKNRLIEVLTETICKYQIVDKMDKIEFGQLILSYFYDEWNDSTYAVHYMEDTRKLLTDNYGRYTTTGRAKKYSDYLDNILAQARDLTRKKNTENEAAEEELLENLLDYLAISLRIYQAMTDDKRKHISHTKDLADTISYNVYSSFSTIQFKYEKQGNIVKSDLTSEWKWFRWFLTKILLIRLMQDDPEAFGGATS